MERDKFLGAFGDADPDLGFVQGKRGKLHLNVLASHQLLDHVSLVFVREELNLRHGHDTSASSLENNESCNRVLALLRENLVDWKALLHRVVSSLRLHVV